LPRPAAHPVTAATNGVNTTDRALPGRICAQLDHHEQAPSQARERYRAELRRHGVADDDVDTVLLLLSELVTNAVRHGGHGPVDVEVDVRDDSITLDVTDPGPYSAAIGPRSTTADDTTGRGLVLVEAFSENWGHGPTDGAALRGTRVWATVNRTG
jgi:anti-sigma regulatory factor (Ser/Thr protein kinase)